VREGGKEGGRGGREQGVGRERERGEREKEREKERERAREKEREEGETGEGGTGLWEIFVMRRRGHMICRWTHDLPSYPRPTTPNYLSL